VIDPAVQKSRAVALTSLEAYGPRRNALAASLVTAAQPPDATPLSLLQTVPGSGKILRLGLLSTLPDIQCFPRGQAFLASCRVATCAKAAAVCCLRAHPAGPTLLANLEKNTAQAQCYRSWPSTWRGPSSSAHAHSGIR
jgi:transposase